MRFDGERGVTYIGLDSWGQPELTDFVLTDEEKAGLPEPQDGYAVLLVIKPRERLTTVKLRTRKPHETLR